jgi:type IV pilus assembly protein PilY1
LAQIIAQAGSDNISRRVYGGDLLGNLWRFNIGTAGYGKQLLATFRDQSGNTQPITARPQVATFNGNPIVYVGTGRYLGTIDVGGTLQQTLYAVKDRLGSTSYGNLRADSTFISKTAVDGTCPNGADVNVCQPGTKVRTVVQNGGAASDSLSSKNGWFVDFPANSGELAFTDPKLVHGTLAFSTSVASATTSLVCGDPTAPDPVAFGYMLDFLTGGAVGTTSGVIASTLGTGIATTAQIAQLPDGTVIGKYRLSSGQEVSAILRFGAGANPTSRVSWRELTND